jgi:hypothetical protein
MRGNSRIERFLTFGGGCCVLFPCVIPFAFFSILYYIDLQRRKIMELQYTYWQDGQFFVGFLNDYPDDSTQGVSLAELEEALVEVYEIKQEAKKHLAEIRKIGRIKIPA